MKPRKSKMPRQIYPLTVEEIEEIGASFKDDLVRETDRRLSRGDNMGALAAVRGKQYIDDFISTLRMVAGSELTRLRLPRGARPIFLGLLDDAKVKQARDAEWTHEVLGITDKVLTPKQGAKWLAQKRGGQ